jgi:hypothetical protein
MDSSSTEGVRGFRVKTLHLRPQCAVGQDAVTQLNSWRVPHQEKLLVARVLAHYAGDKQEKRPQNLINSPVCN